MKLFEGIKYNYISEKAGIKTKTLYSWLAREFDLKENNFQRLKNIIEEM